MPRDPVGIAVLITMATMVSSLALLFVVDRRAFRSLYAATRYAVGYAFTAGGVVVVWAASTIDVPVVPLIYAPLGVFFFGCGLRILAKCKHAAKKYTPDKASQP